MRQSQTTQDTTNTSETIVSVGAYTLLGNLVIKNWWDIHHPGNTDITLRENSLNEILSFLRETYYSNLLTTSTNGLLIICSELKNMFLADHVDFHITLELITELLKYYPKETIDLLNVPLRSKNNIKDIDKDIGMLAWFFQTVFFTTKHYESGNLIKARHLEKLTEFFITLLTSLSKTLDKAELLNILSKEQFQTGDQNGFLTLTNTIHDGILLKWKHDHLLKIMHLTDALLRKIDPPLLLEHFSKASSIANAFYALLFSLVLAIKTEDEAYIEILSSTARYVLKKCAISSDMLKKCLSSKRTDARGEVFSSLIETLAENKNTNINDHVFTLLMIIVEKTHPQDLHNLLTENIDIDISNNKTRLSILLSLLKKTEDKEKLSRLLIFVLIKLNQETLSESTKKLLLNAKDHLKAAILIHIDSVNNTELLKSQTHPNTLLGELIDHKQNALHAFFTNSCSNTRYEVATAINRKENPKGNVMGDTLPSLIKTEYCEMKEFR